MKIDFKDFLQAVAKPELLDNLVIGNVATDLKEQSSLVQTIFSSPRR